VYIFDMFNKVSNPPSMFAKLGRGAAHMFNKMASSSSPLRGLAQGASTVARKIGNTLERAVPIAARAAAVLLPEYGAGILGAGAAAQSAGRAILGARKALISQ
jgi:hypothetical protein